MEGTGKSSTLSVVVVVDPKPAAPNAGSKLGFARARDIAEREESLALRGSLSLSLSRSSPEAVIAGWKGCRSRGGGARPPGREDEGAERGDALAEADGESVCECPLVCAL